MRSLKLTLAYDGTDFAGWQVQPDLPSVQGAIERAFLEVTGERLRVTASGRTDSGVHAIGQVASVSCNTLLACDRLRLALHATTPDSIAIIDVQQADDGFHAIRDAVSKRYRYIIQDGPIQDVFGRRFAWHVRQGLDIPAMRDGAANLLGTHDFCSFEAAGSERATSVRTIHDLDIQTELQHGLRRIILEIEANGFLYNMVRNIVGSLVEVGRGAQPHQWIAQVLAAHDRCAAGPTAPPQGLYLLHVNYPPISPRPYLHERLDS